MGMLSLRQIAVAALCALPLCVPATRYVNSATGSDAANPCLSPSAPCKTITVAMLVALPGPGPAFSDTIEVAPGVYNAASGETFPIVFKSGVKLWAPDNAHRAIVDATGANARILTINVGTSVARIEGLVLRGGRHAPAAGDAVGGAIYIQSGNVTITRNLFHANQAAGFRGASFGGDGGNARGGAIGMSGPGSCSLTNNVFIANEAIGGMGGTFLQGTGGLGGGAHGGAAFVNCARAVNNTFYGNRAVAGGGGVSAFTTGTGGTAIGGALYTFGQALNNIFASNAAIAGQPGGVSAFSALHVYANTSANNLFWLNYLDTSPADPANSLGSFPMILDPVFHHAPDDLHIGLSSPAAHTGIALGLTVDFDGTPRPIQPSRGAFQASGYDFVATDLDGDGRSDLLWRNVSTGQVYRMLMNGLAVADGAVAHNEPNLNWKIVADADFNGDGTSDLLWRNAVTGEVYLMLSNASGLPAAGAVIFTEPNAAWKIVRTPDLDGNGHADLLWWNASTGEVYAMLLQFGVRIAEGMVYTEPDTAWRIVATGDFAGNGKQNQLLWRNSATGQVFLMTVAQAGGGFSYGGAMVHVEPNLAWKIVAAADFDGDQRTDILWRNDVTGAVYVMLMNNSAIAGSGVVHTEPDLAWKIVAAGDYNGDGRADLLWRNDATGQVFVMLMNGLAVTAGAPVFTEPNTDWRLLGPWEYSQ